MSIALISGFAYIKDPREMNDVAKLKLISDTTYDPYDEHHVLAALSFRLSLDIRLHSLLLIRTAVNSNMRVVI